MSRAAGPPLSEARRALVAGWFSFAQGHATAGDVLACREACRWLQSVGCPFDVAFAPPFEGGVDWRSVDPLAYSDVLFVCGPFQKGELEAEFLHRFAGCRLFGLNLSMAAPASEWNPFDFLIVRDDEVETNADMVFLAERRPVPLIGTCLVELHPEAQVERVNAAVKALLHEVEAAIVQIDTRLDANESGLRTPAEVETAIARVDALVTTRLHGLVLALKNGVPVLALDAVPGGGKILRQARKVGWPLVNTLDQADAAWLSEGLAWCLTEEARGAAAECGERARAQAEHVRDRFLAVFRNPSTIAASHLTRTDQARLERFRAEMLAVVERARGTEEPHPTHVPNRRLRALTSRLLRWLPGRPGHNR